MKAGYDFIEVISLTRVYGGSIFLKYPAIVPPAAYVCKVVSTHDHGETVVWFAFTQSIQGAYGVGRSRHAQFYVIDLYA